MLGGPSIFHVTIVVERCHVQRKKKKKNLKIRATFAISSCSFYICKHFFFRSNKYLNLQLYSVNLPYIFYFSYCTQVPLTGPADHYKGILACFLVGFSFFLVLRRSRSLQSLTLVVLGCMMSSTKPEERSQTIITSL